MTQIMGLNLNLGSTEQPPPPFALFCSLQFSPLPHSKPQKPASFPLASCRTSVFLTPWKFFCSPSTIHHHKDAMRNCAMSMDQIQEYRCPLSPVGETPLSPAYSASECLGT